MYRFLLKECVRKKARVPAKLVHTHATKHGLENSRCLGELKISTLVKCGDVKEAVELFGRLPHRTVFAWTSVISGYARGGEGEEALRVYTCMLEEGLKASKYTLVILLKACAGALDLGRGKHIHAEARKDGSETTLFVGTGIVDMYAKCGSIKDARHVFDRLMERDVVSWNVMLAGYAQQGQGNQVLHMYRQMLEDGISATDRTFVSLLQGLGGVAEVEGAVPWEGVSLKLESLSVAKAIHAEVKRKGYEVDLFVGSALIGMFAKCGSMVDAEHVFDALSRETIVTWNVMLAAYAQQDEAAKALQLYEQLYEQLQSGGICPNARTLACALRACGTIAEQEEAVSTDGLWLKVKCLQKGRAMHAEAEVRGLTADLFVASGLVSMYAKCGSVSSAERVFESMSARDVVSWNAMLSGYAQQGEGMKALHLYEQMKKEGVDPDDRTLVSTLQACSVMAEKEDGVRVGGICLKSRSLQVGESLHGDARRWGFESNAFVANALLSMYGKSGSITGAQKIFDQLPTRSVVSYNSIMAAYAQQGEAGEVLKLYGEMADQGLIPDDITYACVLQVCGDSGDLDTCTQIHSELISTGKQPSLLVANTLISAYGKCGSMVHSQAVFDTIVQPNSVSWTALIGGYTRTGDYATSLHCFEEMQEAGVAPTEVTFLALLSVCSHAGLVDKGLEYFKSMTQEHHLSPWVEHYNSLVDLLGRAGYFTEIEALLSQMQIAKDLRMWVCLLGACQKHGNISLAEHAFRCAVELQPIDSSAYVLMSNVYSDAGMLECANKVHQLRQEAGAWKEVGRSWVQHDQRLHTFAVGERDHPHRDQIHSLLTILCD